MNTSYSCVHLKMVGDNWVILRMKIRETNDHFLYVSITLYQQDAQEMQLF